MNTCGMRLAKYSSRMSNFLFRFSKPSCCSFETWELRVKIHIVVVKRLI